MYIYYNANPVRKSHGDCVIRALSRSPVTGRYISNGVPHGNVRMSYGDHYDHMYGHSIKDRMVARLEPMYDEANTEHERQMISNTINQIQSNN